LCYAVFNEFMVRALKLPRIPIPHKFLKLAEEDMEERKISFITYANVDIDGYKKRIFGYVIKKLAFPFILGDPWLKHNNVTYKAKKRQFYIRSKKHRLIIKESG
jgi:CTP:phosphocholine cytidylyltransferase-like protein